MVTVFDFLIELNRHTVPKDPEGIYRPEDMSEHKQREHMAYHLSRQGYRQMSVSDIPFSFLFRKRNKSLYMTQEAILFMPKRVN